ncbi:MAG: CHAT domain-containing protein [Planctomycetes bacterium]|nr:CHAT domain-containing protein [Planctomycetota bacterium]
MRPAAAEPSSRELIDRGQRALSGSVDSPPDLAAARQAFESVLARPGDEFRPWALCRLASIARREDRPWEATLPLREARRLVDSWLADPQRSAAPIVAMSHRLVLKEQILCYRELGLPDLAVDDLRLFETTATNPRDRLEAILLGLDIATAHGDFPLVLLRTKKALADEELLAARGTAAAMLEYFRLLAARQEVPIAEQAAVASQLEALVAAGLSPGPSWRAMLESGEGWIEAGDLQRAAAANDRLRVDATAGPEQKAELLAQRARIAAARGVDKAELAQLQRKLAETVEHWIEVCGAMPIREGGTGTFRFKSSRDAIATTLMLDLQVLEGDVALTAAFDHLESVLALGTVSRRYDCPAATIEDARRLVPPDGGILMFGLGPHAGTLLLFDADGSTHQCVTLGRTFWKETEALQAAVDLPPARGDRADEDATAVRALAERVGQRLLPAAIRDRLGRWRQIVLVGAEDVSGLFQALPWGDSWLCLQKQILHVPSIALAARLRQRAEQAMRGAPEGGLDLAVIGDPVIDPASEERWAVEALGLSATQRAEFGAAFARQRRFEAWGDAATVATLRSADVAAARALCLFTHGVQDLTRERSAGLLLSAAGGAEPLFAEDIEGFGAPQLVMLGVCEAASGPARQGDDGASHLGGAFMLAGADCVVLANGRLSLGATRDLLIGALGCWQRGNGLVEAMRQARVAVAAGEGRAHPYYFAGMRVVGVDVPPPTGAVGGDHIVGEAPGAVAWRVLRSVVAAAAAVIAVLLLRRGTRRRRAGVVRS